MDAGRTVSQPTRNINISKWITVWQICHNMCMSVLAGIYYILCVHIYIHNTKRKCLWRGRWVGMRERWYPWKRKREDREKKRERKRKKCTSALSSDSKGCSLAVVGCTTVVHVHSEPPTSRAQPAARVVCRQNKTVVAETETGLVRVLFFSPLLFSFFQITIACGFGGKWLQGTPREPRGQWPTLNPQIQSRSFEIPSLPAACWKIIVSHAPFQQFLCLQFGSFVYTSLMCWLRKQTHTHARTHARSPQLLPAKHTKLSLFFHR